MARDEGIMTSNIMITAVDERFRSHYIILCRSTKRNYMHPSKDKFNELYHCFSFKGKPPKVGVGVVREVFACGYYGYNSFAGWVCLQRSRI